MRFVLRLGCMALLLTAGCGDGGSRTALPATDAPADLKGPSKQATHLGRFHWHMASELPLVKWSKDGGGTTVAKPAEGAQYLVLYFHELPGPKDSTIQYANPEFQLNVAGETKPIQPHAITSGDVDMRVTPHKHYFKTIHSGGIARKDLAYFAVAFEVRNSIRKGTVKIKEIQEEIEW